MASVKTSSSRLAFLDWTRGLAAVVMLNGHVFHSFTKPESRDGGVYVLTQFIGGMPPAIFLFLVGVTLAFLMESRERQGMSPGRRMTAALRRAGYLLGLAFLFRIQLFLVGAPKTQWADLFRVDILNVMGLSVALLSALALLRTSERVRVCALVGLLIAFAAPLVSALDWSGAPALLHAYVAPDALSFGFFPWAAYVAFGMSAGSILRIAGRDRMDRILQWSALLGLVLIMAARFCADIPYTVYPKSEFWLDSPWLILIKLGVILVTLSAAYLWTQYAAGPGWSWMRQFGTTSLLVYWVHTELVYGRWLYFWKERLTPGQSALAALGVILLMLGLSLVRTNWKAIRAAWPNFGYPFTEPRRVPGD